MINSLRKIQKRQPTFTCYVYAHVFLFMRIYVYHHVCLFVFFIYAFMLCTWSFSVMQMLLLRILFSQ